MNIEIYVKEQYSFCGHIFNMFFIFSESVTTSDGYRQGNVSFANFLLYYLWCISTGLDKQNIQRKIVNIFLPINFSICFGCSKEPSH